MNFDDAPPSAFFVSTDKTLLDVPFIVAELKKSYWGGWLTLPTMLNAIEHSLCFGLYLRENGLHKQIGFARVITDYATFAWVCDVFVAKAHREHGNGTELMRCIMAHPDMDGIACMLTTNDAQKFYRRFGFTVLDEQKCMKRPGSR